jgi:hypothetical protein
MRCLRQNLESLRERHCTSPTRALFLDGLNGAMLLNYILALVVGGVLWFIGARRSRRRATQQIVGPEPRERDC